MKIVLDDPTDFTLDNVRLLLASKDDSAHRQLRVSDDGVAYLSDDVGNRKLDGVRFRFETWNAGNGYCGADAASKHDYVKTVFNDLKCAWNKNLTGYIDYPPCVG